eukprot:TRINITY_DN707_c0_g1_i1.p1 TRINITY_DN707_c0_g1~~TRINITY_DN707_c0_g1_i1.p1  ORF type:complete len:890 (-),score=225.78 TRINITY_DN707_c0_g1_i1:56-2641(-)
MARHEVDHSGHKWTEPKKPETSNAASNDIDAPTKRSVFIARSVIGVMAIAFLWITSLRVATSIAQAYIPAPKNQVLIDDVNYAYNVVVAESDAYSACATAQINGCNSTLSSVVANEVATRTAAQEANAAALDFARVSQQTCSNKVVTLLDSIKQWQQGIYAGRVNYMSTCTADEISQVQNMVGDIAETKSAAYLVGKEYSRDVADISGDAAQSVNNRTTYDQEYLDSKVTDLNGFALDINATCQLNMGLSLGEIDQLKVNADLYATCVSLAAGCPGVGLRNYYSQMRLDISASYADALRTAGLNFNYSLQYETRVNAKLAEIDSFYDQLRGLGSSLSSLGIDMNVAPALYVPPLQKINLPLQAQMPTADALDVNVGSYRTQWNADFNARRLGLQNVGLAWTNSLNGIGFQMVTLFDDYNPPAIDLQTTRLSQRGEQFKVEQAAALSAYQDLAIDTNSTFNTNFTLALSASTLTSTSSLDFEFASMTGGWNFDLLLFTMNNLIDITLAADYVFRAVQTVRYIIIYWGKSAVGLDPVDVRKTKTKAQSDRAAVRLARIVSSPMVPVFLWLLFACIILSAVLAVYLPAYQSYINGCVKSSKGDLVTKNLYAISYNYASNDGNAIISAGLQQHDSDRSKACGAYQQQTTTQQNNDIFNLQSTNTLMTSSAQKMHLLQKCLNFSAADEFQFQLMSLPTPSSQMANALECDAVIATPDQLADGIFDCSVLPACNVTCTGPNQLAIEAVTRTAGCNGEWWFHAKFLRFLGALFIYVCMNVSRMFAVTGACHMYWRQLTTAGFAFIGECTRMGNTTSHMNILEHLNLAIIKYRRTGLMYISMALLMFIPWLIGMDLASQNLVAKDSNSF